MSNTSSNSGQMQGFRQMPNPTYFVAQQLPQQLQENEEVADAEMDWTDK